MKKYLYHRAPANMQGNILYPLNALKEINSKLYNFQASKYKGREFVMEQKVPGLDCIWNDVIFISAINPQEMADYIQKEYSVSMKGQKYFIIDPEILDKEKTTVYLFDQKIEKEKFDESNWCDFEEKDIEKYSQLNQRMKDYHKSKFDNGEQPLLWAFTPHILYKGKIDISNCKILEIK
jgi:hypothetical protein